MEKGTRIIIKSVSKTEETIGLDIDGAMKKMVGGIYTIKGKSRWNDIDFWSMENKGFPYAWHVNDLEIIKPKSIKSVVFNFNPKDLDI